MVCDMSNRFVPQLRKLSGSTACMGTLIKIELSVIDDTIKFEDKSAFYTINNKLNGLLGPYARRWSSLLHGQQSQSFFPMTEGRMKEGESQAFSEPKKSGMKEDQSIRFLIYYNVIV
uniref:Uncharacterized protein n=1 Tax=Romanomermis culicivorax TaxID=13658 RepID=A0A915KKN7_ROMCU